MEELARSWGKGAVKMASQLQVGAVALDRQGRMSVLKEVVSL